MPLNIAIAGAGIGGLVAAIGLARNGHSVTVYERLADSGGVGYSFRFMKNAARCLDYINIDPRTTGAVTANLSRHLLARNGQLLREFDERSKATSKDELFTGFVSRGALSGDLARAAAEAGVEIHNDVKVVRADVERNALIFADGREATADVIIGADGIHSAVRRSFVEGERAQPQSSGDQNAVRFLVPMSRVRDGEDTASIGPLDNASYLWFASDRRIIAYPIDFGDVMSVASAHPAALSDIVARDQDSETAASYDKKVSLERVLEIHSDFEPRVQSLLKLADPEGFRVWKLQDLDDIGSWSSGRTTVLGDACHATLPSSFSGASMAIEDGVTLAVLLDSKATVTDVEKRFAIYQRVRKPRTDRVREFGRGLEKAHQSNEAVQSFTEFVDGHDAVKEAQKALEKAGL